MKGNKSKQKKSSTNLIHEHYATEKRKKTMISYANKASSSSVHCSPGKQNNLVTYKKHINNGGSQSKIPPNCIPLETNSVSLP